MVTDKSLKLAELKRQVAKIEREMAHGPCSEHGHEWEFYGGSNLGCDPDCACGGSVYVCLKCGDCDYGDNEENDELRANCDSLINFKFNEECNDGNV